MHCASTSSPIPLSRNGGAIGYIRPNISLTQQNSTRVRRVGFLLRGVRGDLTLGSGGQLQAQERGPRCVLAVEDGVYFIADFGMPAWFRCCEHDHPFISRTQNDWRESQRELAGRLPNAVSADQSHCPIQFRHIAKTGVYFTIADAR